MERGFARCGGCGETIPVDVDTDGDGRTGDTIPPCAHCIDREARRRLAAVELLRSGQVDDVGRCAVCFASLPPDASALRKYCELCRPHIEGERGKIRRQEKSREAKG